MNDNLNTCLAEACEVLEKGGTLIYPTDTIWGIGCDATSETAVERVIRIKGRAENKSFIILVSDTAMMGTYLTRVPEIACRLMEVSDSPLTIVCPGAVNVARQVMSAKEEVGIRIPDHPFCQGLISRFRKPLLSTSANFSGAPSPRNFADIDPALLQAVDWVAPAVFQAGATGKASSIIRVGLKGEIEILRY